MFEEMTEQQAREQILEMTRNYCEKYHNKKKPYQKGDRIPYASRVYDAEEMVNLVDSSRLLQDVIQMSLNMHLQNISVFVTVPW